MDTIVAWVTGCIGFNASVASLFPQQKTHSEVNAMYYHLHKVTASNGRQADILHSVSEELR